MANGTDDYELEAMADDHPVAVKMFVPFVIARLCPSKGIHRA
jgi:hypothetical protein